MKISKKFKKYFKKRKRIIRAILKEPENASLKDIHKLRVSIKKMRAIIALINFSSKKFKKKKYLKPYKKIFKQAGKVRNLQIEESTLKGIQGHKQLENYLSELSDRRENEKRKWVSLASNKKSKKIKKGFNDLIPYFKNVKRKGIRKFIKRKRKYILKFMKSKRWKKKHLHRFRKKLKVLYYIIKISHSNNKELKKGIGYMQKLIGDWHDYVMIIKHVKRVVNSRNISSDERMNLEILKRKLGVKRRVLYAEIKNQRGKLRQLLKHV